MKISSIDTNVLTKQFNTGNPLCLRGRFGVAKTAIIEQFCEEQQLGLVTQFLPADDAPNAMGFLIPTKTDDGPVSKFSKPDWLRKVEEKIAEGFEQGVLFLDEFLAADHIVQKAYAPLLSEGRIGEWELPEGWVVWLAGNRSVDRSGANKMLGHVGNRMCVIDVESCLEGWTKWAGDNGIHPMYIAFAQARPGVVFTNEPVTKPDEQQISPRSLHRAHDYHTSGVDFSMELDNDVVTQGMIAGYIGDAASAELFGFLKTADELPSIDEIETSPMTAKLPSEHRLDAQYAAVQLVVHHTTPDNIDQLFQYVTRLNKELQASAAKQLIDKTKGSLLNSAALGKWISENQSLVSNTFA